MLEISSYTAVCLMNKELSIEVTKEYASNFLPLHPKKD